MKEDINRQLSVCGANQQDCLVSFSLCFLPPSKKGDLLQSAEKKDRIPNFKLICKDVRIVWGKKKKRATEVLRELNTEYDFVYIVISLPTHLFKSKMWFTLAFHCWLKLNCEWCVACTFAQK